MNNSSSGFFRLASFLLFAFLGLPLATAAGAQAKTETYPQIVRLSYVQGDVRFSRGDGRHPDLTKLWEQAEVNVPILKGYALSTGNGRAEIEFEYGSIVYLAENSLLLFKTLTTKDGVPSTEVELVTGSASISYHPIPKEVFDLNTPSEQMQLAEPVLVRIDSYLDGAAVTIHGDGWDKVALAHLGSIISNQRVAPGQPESDHSSTPADWDGWVSARVRERQADTAAALKASGLTSFIPGLTDLYTGGTFFACPPFGTCWEPNVLPDANGGAASTHAGTASSITSATPSNAATPASQPVGPVAEALPAVPSAASPTETGATIQPVTAPSNANATTAATQVVGAQVAPEQPSVQRSTTALAQTAQKTASNSGTAPAPPTNPKLIYRTEYYPPPECSYYQLRVVTATDSITRKRTVVEKTEVPSAGVGWPWALCHSGAWVHLPRHGTQYTFVVRRKRHHPPVVWVHTAQSEGYVPKHPSDVKGKPPLNLKYGIFVAQKGSDGQEPNFEHIAFASAEKCKVLSQAPRELRDVKYPQLAAAERPEIHARLVASSFGAKTTPAPGTKSTSAPITYDYKSRRFLQAGVPTTGRTGRPLAVGGLSARGGYTPSGGRGGSGGGIGGTGGGGGRVAGGGGRGGGGGTSAGGSGGGAPSRAGGGGSSGPASSASPRKSG